MGLKRVVRTHQYFALAFGCIVGSGWVVVLGDWLGRAGPGGALLGFAVGAAVMICVALSYGELTSRMPLAGGEIVYTQEMFGPRVAYLVGWFLSLFMVSLTAFEGIALGWIIGVLIPGSEGNVIYSVLGTPVTDTGIELGVGVALLLGWFNFRGVQAAIRFQTIVTFAFLALAVATLAAGSVSSRLENLHPWIAQGGTSPWWAGSLWIFATAAFWYNGFQAVPQAIEERSENTSLHQATYVMILAIVFAAMFYMAVVLVAGSLTPWHTLVSVDLATARAFEHAPLGKLLSRAILAAAALSVLKVWNGAEIMSIRLLLAQARFNFIPRTFARLHPIHRTPTLAVAAVVTLNVAGIMLGKGAIASIINMAAISVAIIFVVVLAGLLKLRRQSPRPAPCPTPGGTKTIVVGLVGSASMAAYAILDPWLNQRKGIPTEWILLSAWGAIGLVLWAITRRKGDSNGDSPPLERSDTR
jgi:basic amino acid/polyamine antiporter, APA family